MARTGRRPGNADTRAEILEAARSAFAESSYDAVTLRGVARAAGVDPALLHHYFDGKSGLFAEVMQLPADPSVVLPAALAGPADGLGERLARFFLGLWERPETGPRMAAWFRSALATEEASVRSRDFLTAEVLSRILAALPPEHRDPERVALAAAQLVGLAVVRYLIGVGPLAAASTDDLVARVAPVLQAYLTGAAAPADGAGGG